MDRPASVELSACLDLCAVALRHQPAQNHAQNEERIALTLVQILVILGHARLAWSYCAWNAWASMEKPGSFCATLADRAVLHAIDRAVVRYYAVFTPVARTAMEMFRVHAKKVHV
jgi:hypothetical protein